VGGQEDFVASLEAIMAVRREALREPPTPEELLAYRDGRLDEAERRALEARIDAFPEAARALTDLAAFPDVEPAPGAPVVTEEEVGRRWHEFRRRLEAASRSPGARRRRGGAPTPPAPAAMRRRAFRWLPTRSLAAAAGAALVAGLAAGFVTGRLLRDARPEPRVNVAIVELVPVGEGRVRSAGPETVEVAAESEAVVLVLGLAEPPEEGQFSDFRAEMLDARGARVWSRRGLRPTALGDFHVALRREGLEPGVYRIHLDGLAEGKASRLATFELRLREGQTTP
jgi:anti-sigma factor RsiW